MFQSGGVLMKSVDQIVWSGTPQTWGIGAYWEQNLLAGLSYGEIYTRQLWVATLVNKRAKAAARLPLKVYERTAGGRDDATSSPYGQLLARPNAVQDPFFFWLWTASTRDVYGEAFWGKVRDRGGRPVELVLLHPTSMYSTLKEDTGKVEWTYDDGRVRFENIPRRDLVHFKAYHPMSTIRGLSPLEPLRATLENEEGARRANSAMWKHGGRPSAVLKHPKSLSAPAAKRLAGNWSDVNSGVDNWAKTVLLEEGLDVSFVPLNVEELQYIEARKVNREEACAIYDVPPPVVHILDRATFSNITEQMRSMYRDTMAPLLKEFESTLEFDLRDGRFGATGDPDFGPVFYAEFLMDEVLRGDFEDRVNAYQAGINSGWLMPAEVREMENRPFVDGSDVLLINSTLVPIGSTDPNLDGEAPGGPSVASLSVQAVRTVMGRLSRTKSLTDVDLGTLTAGLNGSAAMVSDLFEVAADLTDFKARLRAAGRE